MVCSPVWLRAHPGTSTSVATILARSPGHAGVGVTTITPTRPPGAALSVSEVVCTRDLEKYRHVQGSAAIRAVRSRVHDLTGSSVLLCTTVKPGCRWSLGSGSAVERSERVPSVSV